MLVSGYLKWVPEWGVGEDEGGMKERGGRYGRMGGGISDSPP